MFLARYTADFIHMKDQSRYSFVDWKLISISDREKRTEELSPYTLVSLLCTQLGAKKDMWYLSLSILHTVIRLDEEDVRSESF